MQLSIDSLLAERAEQQSAIGPLLGEQLRVRAEALGLRVASDSELVVLTLPTGSLMAKPATTNRFSPGGARARRSRCACAGVPGLGRSSTSVWKDAGRVGPRQSWSRCSAWRGTIYDRNGAALAVTRVSYHINVAVDQLRDTTAAIGALARALGRSSRRRSGRRSTDSRNVYFHGPYTAQQVNQLRGVRGIYRDPVLDRSYPRYAARGADRRRVQP